MIVNTNTITRMILILLIVVIGFRIILQFGLYIHSIYSDMRYNVCVCVYIYMRVFLFGLSP